VAGPAGVAASPLGAGAWDDEARDGELTREELARLAAWDRAGDFADELDEHEAWLAGLLLEPGEEPAEAAVPEALPGLTPRRWGMGDGFDAGLVADTFPPGPVLAGLAADKQAEGLARASDDELAGLMIAWRRIGSWAAAGELAAVAELDRRRTAQVAAGAAVHLGEHVADEVAMALTLTSRAADSLTDFAVRLARLPKTRAALQAGDIDVPPPASPGQAGPWLAPGTAAARHSAVDHARRADLRHPPSRIPRVALGHTLLRRRAAGAACRRPAVRRRPMRPARPGRAMARSAAS